MKRFALIIYSPSYGEQFLPGAGRDADNVYNYLTSSIGGAFIPDLEIVKVRNPRKNILKKLLSRANKADIAIVYFAGHGYRFNDSDYMCINDDEQVLVKDLYVPAKRQLTFIDACRTALRPEQYKGIGDLGFFFPSRDLEEGRELYNLLLQNAPIGHILTFSTMPGDAARDTPDGGIYTYSFMQALYDWNIKQQSAMLTIGQAFSLSYQELRLRDQIQTPIRHVNNNLLPLEIPFAINVDVSLQIIKKELRHLTF